MVWKRQGLEHWPSRNQHLTAGRGQRARGTARSTSLEPSLSLSPVHPARPWHRVHLLSCSYWLLCLPSWCSVCSMSRATGQLSWAKGRRSGKVHEAALRHRGHRSTIYSKEQARRRIRQRSSIRYIVRRCSSHGTGPVCACVQEAS